MDGIEQMDKMAKNGTYTVNARCSNCGWANELTVMRSQPLFNESCPRCGCSETLSPTMNFFSN